MGRQVGRVGSVVGIALLLVALAAGSATADSVAAKRLVVGVADVGVGFGPAPTASGSDVFPKLAGCVGKSASHRKVVGRAAAGLASGVDGSMILSSASIMKTKAMVTQDRRVMVDPKFAACVAQFAAGQLPGGGSGVSATSQSINVGRYGDSTSAIEIRLLAPTLAVTITQVAIQQGRAEIDVQFVNLGPSPFDATARDAVLAKLGQRLA